MMPKGTWLTRHVRIFIMLSLMALFFIISPLIILYTAGYRFNIANWELIRTGVISIDVRPRNATVYLNTVPIDKGLPLRLNNRASGIYTVHIAADGYHSWSKDISVESNKTTYIRDIVLPKMHTPEATNVYTPDATYQFAAAPNDPVSLLTITQDNVIELGVFTARTNTFEPLIRRSTNDTISIEWSPFGPYAAVTITGEDNTLLYLIDATLRETSTGYTLTEHQQYTWDATAPVLYVQSATGEITSITTNGTSSVAIVTSTDEWYVTDTTLVTLQRSRDTNQSLTFTDTNTSFALPEPIERIILLTDSILIGKDESAIKLFHTSDVDIRFVAAIENATVMRYGERDYLIWSPTEAWSFSPEGQASLLYRTSNPVVHINTFDEFGSLLLTTKTGLEIFNPGYVTYTTLLSNTSLSSTLLDNQNNRMYFPATFGSKTDIYELQY